MKKGLLLAFLCVGTILSAQTVFDFTLVNATGYDIAELYVSPAGDEEWGDDILGTDILADGDSWDVAFDSDYADILLAFGVEFYDVKIVFTDGSTYFWKNFKLQKISMMTIHISGGKLQATTE